MIATGFGGTPLNQILAMVAVPAGIRLHGGPYKCEISFSG